jgi:hypothetical protein
VFGTFVNVFLVPKLEVGYGVVADLSDEGVVVCGTLTENFFRQTVDELVQRFYVKCVNCYIVVECTELTKMCVSHSDVIEYLHLLRYYAVLNGK